MIVDFGCRAALLLHPRSVVPVARLTELLWDGAAPPTAATMVHAAVAGLRRTLTGVGAPSLLDTRAGDYWHHQRLQNPHPTVHDQRFQDQLLDSLARFTGTALT